MPDLFMVMATQNPIEQEGTYPLPEAQMDRFLMHVLIDYPDEKSEEKILKLVRGEEMGTKGETQREEPEAIPQDAVFDARKEIHEIHVSEAIEHYVVALVNATRCPDRYSDDLKRWIQVGASPRGGIGLDKCSRVHAWLSERDHVTPDDVRAVIHDVFRHRLMLSYEANAEGITANQVVGELVKLVAVA
jgi:MoxR-like ATPase